MKWWCGVWRQRCGSEKWFHGKYYLHNLLVWSSVEHARCSFGSLLHVRKEIFAENGNGWMASSAKLPPGIWILPLSLHQSFCQTCLSNSLKKKTSPDMSRALTCNMCSFLPCQLWRKGWHKYSLLCVFYLHSISTLNKALYYLHWYFIQDISNSLRFEAAPNDNTWYSIKNPIVVSFNDM